ncbi:hypothetical protein K474DRAFT_714693 [Panus rudis PR-1116 ss-1]|nr:hypothetical protein K474DRAFT_714693 [Panus rudis PR-1116 ss-1]
MYSREGFNDFALAAGMSNAIARETAGRAIGAVWMWTTAGGDEVEVRMAGKADMAHGYGRCGRSQISREPPETQRSVYGFGQKLSPASVATVLTFKKKQRCASLLPSSSSQDLHRKTFLAFLASVDTPGQHRPIADILSS